MLGWSEIIAAASRGPCHAGTNTSRCDDDQWGAETHIESVCVCVYAQCRSEYIYIYEHTWPHSPHGNESSDNWTQGPVRIERIGE